MTEANKVLELKNINKSFQSLKVLQNLNLEIKKGEICCLLGPSGSGKTTLFRIASGLENADSGQIIKNNKLRFAYVFQSPRLLPWKTAAENLIFVQKNYGLEKEAELRNLLFELSGLAQFKDAYPHEFSGGMQQRLELIRAFAVKPDLVFLDEPFKSLDMKTRVNLRKLISVIQAETGITIFLITHDPEEALLLADRIYILAAEAKGIKKEIMVEQPRDSREIADPELYRELENIMEIFTDLVSDIEYVREDIKKLF
ncbi:NitT/TauT family transport system ATP-binding protein [Halanaerobium saccharolyticum]|uniref:NitT/TauT family transport system ATP-binding protein n=1 Tax=Halanaerobium saccharolyticum TaxID=43595 RepID=A0A4R6LZS2_9FIRM|nr:ABC transporter ATP-binding protein [Halanaerobium saccharolyticum]TDO94401.1 NitT/TauT family transport system ATP-binding protein [Halanaerobium saccharolyticum]